MRLNLFIRTITFLSIVLVFYGCPSEELTSARLYVQQEDWAKAEDMIKAAIEVTPDDPEPYYLMGKEIYGRNFQWKEMNEMFNKALNLNASYKLPDGKTIQSSVETWRTVHWSREFNIGADAFNLALRAEDKDEKKSHLIEAIDGFNKAKLIRPDDPQSYKTLVSCYIQLENQELLESTLEEALKINPDDPDLLFTAGQNFKENGDLDQAIEYLERGLRINPASSIGASILANAYYEQGDPESAVFAYTKAIRVEPDNPDLHFNLGVLYLQLKDYEMVEEEFQNVLRLNPDDTQAIIGIGEAYQGMERWEDAEYYYGLALRKDPDNPALLRNLGVVIYRQGRTEEGQELFDRAKAGS